MSKNQEELIKKLQEPFKQSEVEWRVQSQGKTNKGFWCQVLAYIDARAIQKRLDDVVGVMNWSDTYECINVGNTTEKVTDKNKDVQKFQNAFICTLTIEADGKKISKQNGSEETQVEGFKGGMSSSFKRVAASGFGIGRYLYDLDVQFAETSEQDMRNDKNWNRASLYNKTTRQYETYYWKTPKLPNEALPSIATITEVDAAELKELATLKGQKLALVLQRFKIQKLGELSKDAFNQIKDEWSRL